MLVRELIGLLQGKDPEATVEATPQGGRSASPASPRVPGSGGDEMTRVPVRIVANVTLEFETARRASEWLEHAEDEEILRKAAEAAGDGLCSDLELEEV
jgi:hypothetical protein